MPGRDWGGGGERDEPSSRTSITAILPRPVSARRSWERARAVRRSGTTEAGAMEVAEAMLGEMLGLGVNGGD